MAAEGKRGGREGARSWPEAAAGFGQESPVASSTVGCWGELGGGYMDSRHILELEWTEFAEGLNVKGEK